jgi:hypothetical protein
MMKRIILFFAAVLTGVSFCLLVHCSSQPTVAGTGSSAGNGRIECFVSDSTGSGCPDLQVYLKKIAITGHNDSVLEEWTRTTDVNGRFGFDSLPPGSFAAGCERKDLGIVALASKVRSEMDSTINLNLDRPIVYKGRLLLAVGMDFKVVSVFIPGSSAPAARIDANGFYVLPDVPLGQHDITFRYGAIVNYLPVKVDRATRDTMFLRDIAFAQDEAHANATYSFYQTALPQTYSVLFRDYDSTTTPSWYAGKDFSWVTYYKVVNGTLVEVDVMGNAFVVLDNFDDGDSLTCLNQITGHSGWQVVTDAKDGGTTKLLPDSTAWHFARAITDINSFSGKSLNITFLMGTTPPALTPYSYITCVISPKSRGYANLTSMTEFSFYAMGKGTIRVVFRSHKALAGYAPADWWGQMSTVLACPATWQRISIVPADIKAPQNSKQQLNGLTWASVRDSIDRIEFAAWMNKGDTVSMALDNIMIHGVSDADFR